MPIDPRIILGLEGVDLGAAISGGVNTFSQLQKAQQRQAFLDQRQQAGQQKAQQQQLNQQQLSEAQEFQTNIRPFIGKDPFKALENVQNSTVLDDEDKRQVIDAINAEAAGNPAPLQALTQMTDQALGAEQFSLGAGDIRFSGSTPIAFGGEDPKAAEKRVASEIAQSKTKFDQAAKLRAEITKSASGFDQIVGSFDRINASENTGPGDLSLIFNFMKMLDPGSVVREGEFASAENAGGVPEKVRNLFNKLNTGERLTPKQRKSFLSQSKSIFNKSKKRHDQTIKGFVNLASKLDLERDLIVLPRGEELDSDPSTDLKSLTDDELFNF